MSLPNKECLIIIIIWVYPIYGIYKFGAYKTKPLTATTFTCTPFVVSCIDHIGIWDTILGLLSELFAELCDQYGSTV